MIASSLRDADDVVDLLLNKEADVNAKSTSLLTLPLSSFVSFPLPLSICSYPIS